MDPTSYQLLLRGLKGGEKQEDLVAIEADEVPGYLQYIQQHHGEYDEFAVVAEEEGLPEGGKSVEDVSQSFHMNGDLINQEDMYHSWYPDPPKDTISEFEESLSYYQKDNEGQWVSAFPKLEIDYRYRSDSQWNQFLANYQRLLPEFFASWPSFEVLERLRVVYQLSQKAFFYGYIMSSSFVINRILNICSSPKGIITSAGLLSGCYTFFPSFLSTAVTYVVIGGLSGGVLTSVPILLIGSGAVFVSASLYHSYTLFKRTLGVSRKLIQNEY